MPLPESTHIHLRSLPPVTATHPVCGSSVRAVVGWLRLRPTYQPRGKGMDEL